MTIIENPTNRSSIYCGFAVVLLSYTIVALIGGLLTKSAHVSLEHVLLISRLLLWFFFAVLCIYSLKVERQPLVLWQDKRYSFGMSTLSVIAVLGALFFGLIAVSIIVKLLGVPTQSSKRLEQMIVVFKQNKFLLFFTAFTAGVTEELTFRAYLMPRLEMIFKNGYLPIIISSLVFGLMHISYGTLMQVLGPLYIGIVFGIYYYKFRNIKVLIICHFLWDFLALVIKTR